MGLLCTEPYHTPFDIITVTYLVNNLVSFELCGTLKIINIYKYKIIRKGVPMRKTSPHGQFHLIKPIIMQDEHLIVMQEEHLMVMQEQHIIAIQKEYLIIMKDDYIMVMQAEHLTLY